MTPENRRHFYHSIIIIAISSFKAASEYYPLRKEIHLYGILRLLVNVVYGLPGCILSLLYQLAEYVVESRLVV